VKSLAEGKRKKDFNLKKGIAFALICEIRQGKVKLNGEARGFSVLDEEGQDNMKAYLEMGSRTTRMPARVAGKYEYREGENGFNRN